MTERSARGNVQPTMTNKILRVALAAVLAAAFWWLPACSAAGDQAADNSKERHLSEDISAVLESVPGEMLTRFILTVQRDKDSKIAREQVDAVVEVLRQAGADVEWLEDSPVIFATCEKAAIYRAIETGYIATVQVDRLRKPMD
jgi:hypothetical protein